jgi:hypothetical protein
MSRNPCKKMSDHKWVAYYGPGRKYGWRIVCEKCGGKARG